ncbi:hypothetical protein PR08_gp56 [Idiomarinaceae phage Phi1M2-2]|uniref:hypothetical protein n=1 Tax=Idiomarinaceae phage Phi1M2-2 TaxID=1527515 RepID=UPI0004F7CC49|nr:hypothetical protein PR08_gp56 [Idiomarinaceae phage Phi1M2-2]AIM40813.1 hypothetical protein M22_056 [Idiomarinaceae phage Phi1M2-2]
MDINHEKLSNLSAELGAVLDKEKPANDAPVEVQECLLLLTYHFAELVYEHEEPKEAIKSIPESFQEDVRAVAKMIHKHRRKN